MEGKKKGISSILGALIFLQILLVSLLLVIHVISNETNIMLKSVQKFQVLSENAPIEEEIENNITYLYSSTPFVITHVIYPNGEIVNISIVVNNKYPVSQILNGYPWAIVVTSKGTWYNVSPLGNGDSGLITFPNYHNYGMPYNPSVLNVTGIPNWNVLEGIASPSALSLVPVNVTIGDPITYHWALTDAALVVYPLSPTGWINITYTAQTQTRSWYVGYQPPNSGITYWTTATESYILAQLGIYIPTKVDMTFEIANYAKYPPQKTITNSSALEYLYVYTQDYEVLNSTWNGQIYNITEISPIMGTQKYNTPSYYTYWDQPYLPSYPIQSRLPEVISNISILPSPLYDNYSPLNINLPINLKTAKIYVFQTDINLYKGVVLNYGYDSNNNSWILLGKFTFNYNNPKLYSNLISKGYLWFPLNPITEAYLLNIVSIQYLTMYPIYIAIPQGVYVLQVSLS